MKPTLQPGLYEHFKGNQYQVIDLARHSETEEWLVVYRPLYGERDLWVRPMHLFTDTKSVNGCEVPRFRRVGDMPMED